MNQRFTAERYDYQKQAWIGADGRYLCCAHPARMNCSCYGRLHAGELAKAEKPDNEPENEACGYGIAGHPAGRMSTLDKDRTV